MGLMYDKANKNNKATEKINESGSPNRVTKNKPIRQDLKSSISFLKNDFIIPISPTLRDPALCHSGLAIHVEKTDKTP